MSGACGRFGCGKPATHRVVPQYDRPFLRCAEHVGAALEAYSKFDNRQMSGTRAVEL